MAIDPREHGNSAGILVDCVIRIVGWFQVSGILDPTTNEYLPETNPDGSFVSGPGWQAYQKPGAQPGDIVIIYTLSTVSLNPTSLISIGNTLWDIVNPNGLSYSVNQYSPKVGINRSDIVSLFPHAGGSFSPTNPNNPNGYNDILWRNVTTYYGLPGPGNPNAPQFVRRSLPEFGVRIIVWTDSCCVNTQVTSKPPSPPPIITPPPTPTPGTGTPVDPPRTPDSSDVDELSTSLRNESSVVNAVTQGGRSGLNDLGPGNGREGSLPTYKQPTEITKSTKYIPRTQGSSQGVFNYGTDYQKSVFDAEGFPLGFRSRTGTQDSYVVRRAVHVGNRYMYKKDKLIDPILIQRKTTRYTVSFPTESLDALGLSSSSGLSSNSVRYGTSRPPINTANGSSFALPEYKGSQDTFGISQTDQADINISGGISHANTRVDQSTRGGFTTSSRPTASSFTPNSSGYTKTLGAQTRSSRVLVTKNPLASKLIKETNKGSFASDLGGITSRTIKLNRAVDSSVKKKGFDVEPEPRYQGPKLDDLVPVQPVSMVMPIKDTTNRFNISFVPLRLVNGSSPTPAVLSMIEARVDTHLTLVVGNSFIVNTAQGSTAYSMGSQAVEFGVINPVQPGMYVIANPLCTPGQGFMPDIIAGGRTWTFAQLVTTLMTLEGTVLAQNVYTFNPASANATDIVAPNRLPVGLMRSLDLYSTADFNYEGTVSYGGTNQSIWYKSEPSVIVTPVSATQTVAIVLKATVTALSQQPPFRPVLELYNDSLISKSEYTVTNAETVFVGSSVSSLPGWYNGGMALNTTGPGNSGLGGKGGTSAFITDQYGNINSGPFNPSLYGGTHQCYLLFKYSEVSAINDRDAISQGTNYRIRVYNNGPYSDKYGYVLYTTGLRIPAPSGTITVSNGQASGTIATYHCNQIIKIRNKRTGVEVERMSNWINGSVELAAGPTDSGPTWGPEIRLDAIVGDVLEIFRPGYDNLYSSENLVGELTVS